MKCPHCGAEIDSLRFTETSTVTGEVSLGPQGRLVQENENRSVDILSFECPECDEQVTGDFDTAGQLLGGK